MFPIQEQFSAVTKASFESNFALCASLTGKTLETVEKLINLNLTAARASMDESAAAARQMLATKDMQELASLVIAQAKPNLEKAIAYSSHVATIASSSQAEFAKVAEQQMAVASRRVSELVEDAAGKLPAGSENLVTMMKSAMTSANAGYEQLSKAGKQATDALQANISSAVSRATQAADAATPAQEIIVKAS